MAKFKYLRISLFFNIYFYPAKVILKYSMNFNIYMLVEFSSIILMLDKSERHLLSHFHNKITKKIKYSNILSTVFL